VKRRKNTPLGLLLVFLIVSTSIISNIGCRINKPIVANIDWVDFVKFNDITYIRTYIPVLIPEQDLNYYDRVRFKLADNVSSPSYRSRNGDAAILEKGTIIYSIRDYLPECRYPRAKPVVLHNSSFA
jgi:hypothetical protein